MTRWIALLALLIFASCRFRSGAPTPVDEVPATNRAIFTATETQAPQVEALTAAPLNLFEVQLPAGTTQSINIGWFNNGNSLRYSPATWLSQGYDGIKFVGAGRDLTHIRCSTWDGGTVSVIRHNGVVQFENLTIHSGYDRATNFGEQNLARVIVPGFRVRMINVKVIADAPFDYFTREQRYALGEKGSGYAQGETLTAIGGVGTLATFRVAEIEPGVLDTTRGAVKRLALISIGTYSRPPPTGPLPTASTGSGTGCTITLGQRPKWLVFGYNFDLYLKDCLLVGKEAVEHDVYVHGFAKDGAYVDTTVFESAGAEGFKVRSDATETAWAGPNVWIVIKRSTFKDWHQDWSWRGGAGIVVQGGAANIFLEQNLFRPGPGTQAIKANDRSHCIAISSEGASYDQATGAVGTGFGNGIVLIRECAASGFSDVAWNNSIVRCARNSGSQWAAKSLTIERSGLWGQLMTIQTGEIPAGKTIIRGCNTAAIKAYCMALGMSTQFEATFPTSTRLVPISEGIVR